MAGFMAGTWGPPSGGPIRLKPDPTARDSTALAAYLRPLSAPPPLNSDVCETLHEQGVGPFVYRVLCERHLLEM